MGVIDGEGGHGHFRFRHDWQGDQLIRGGGSDVELLKRGGVFLEIGRNLKNDAVLIELTKDRSHLPLPKCVVKNVVNRLRRNAVSADRVAIDLQHHSRSCRLQITCDVLQLRQSGKLVENDRCPLKEFSDVGVLQRVLILGLGNSSADLYILACLPKQSNSGNLQGGLPKAIEDLGGTRLALAERLQIDHHST